MEVAPSDEVRLPMHRLKVISQQPHLKKQGMVTHAFNWRAGGYHWLLALTGRPAHSQVMRTGSVNDDVSENKVGNNKGKQRHQPLTSKCTYSDVHACAHTNINTQNLITFKKTTALTHGLRCRMQPLLNPPHPALTMGSSCFRLECATFSPFSFKIQCIAVLLLKSRRFEW